MSEFNRMIFLSEVWEKLENVDPTVLKKFISKMKILNMLYELDGGIYPAVDYVLGLVRDEIKQENEDNVEPPEETSETRRQKIRDSWDKFENLQKK